MAETLVLGGGPGVSAVLADGASLDVPVPLVHQGKYVRILSDQNLLVGMVEDTGSLSAFADVVSETIVPGVPEQFIANVPEQRVIPRADDPSNDVVLRFLNSSGSSAILRLTLTSEKVS